MLDGQPLVVRTIDRLAALSDDLLVVTNEAARFESLGLPVRLVPDQRPGEGALMGIYSGLRVARHPHALVVACDMPLLSLPLLRYMLPLANGCHLSFVNVNTPEDWERVQKLLAEPGQPQPG